MNYLQKAIKNLRPNCSFSIENTYESLVWFTEDIDPPSKDEVDAEIERLRIEWDKTEYMRLRQQEYPSIIEYIDGVVKGDKNQVQRYIDECNRIKKKYPKP